MQIPICQAAAATCPIIDCLANLTNVVLKLTSDPHFNGVQLPHQAIANLG